ncbi:MAG: 30S ribosomal protein S4e [Candidatus Altiarchaeales archaeon ex4484_2]|nr:MAG: 30S ribosomal protein S4e [Candidatus Altiarchaeales archaeon ex4484_2]
MTHTKRIATGYGKKPRFISTVRAGPHPKKKSITLSYILRDILGYAKTAKEARKILNSDHVLVDKKVRRDPNYGVGLMDVVEIPDVKKRFIVLPKKKTMVLKEIKKKDAGTKLCKIIDKTVVRGGRIQLNFHDGSNIIVDKKDKKDYMTKDSVVLELPERKIKDLVKFKEGNTALVVDGVHAGEIGKIDKIMPGSRKHKSLTRLGELQTLTSYLFIVGKKNSLLDL